MKAPAAARGSGGAGAKKAPKKKKEKKDKWLNVSLDPVFLECAQLGNCPSSVHICCIALYCLKDVTLKQIWKANVFSSAQHLSFWFNATSTRLVDARFDQQTELNNGENWECYTRTWQYDAMDCLSTYIPPLFQLQGSLSGHPCKPLDWTYTFLSAGFPTQVLILKMISITNVLPTKAWLTHMIFRSPVCCEFLAGLAETDSEDTDLADEFLIGFEEGVPLMHVIYVDLLHHLSRCVCWRA